MNRCSYLYENYKDPAFRNCRIRHQDVKARVAQIQLEGLFNVRELGRSAQAREIYCITAGAGSVKVLVWSQMHGDEPTGTMALFDLLKFLQSSDEHNELRSLILSKCTLYFIPMLNPDGAELCQRRNAQGIDINRDFLSLQTSEARILFDLAQAIQPHFGFNLHDQSNLWSVMGNRQPASISLLAPPVDGLATVTPCRQQAMQLVSGLYKLLQERIPGQVGRWSEEYEPRAVGETFQSMGISTVLIEAGGIKNDPGKQYLRELNFDLLLHSLVQIGGGTLRNEDSAAYFDIPLNNKELFHLLIRNCKVGTPAGEILADIGLNFVDETCLLSGNNDALYKVADFGDLSTFGAYEIIEAEGATLSALPVIDSTPAFNLEFKGEVIVAFDKGKLVKESLR